ncbi:MAG: hypothetical protein ACHP8A_04110 [Terriglobales bacterium]|jgi:hypothetical protein|nr:hypothetical protein [Terriglobales bacterium]
MDYDDYDPNNYYQRVINTLEDINANLKSKGNISSLWWFLLVMFIVASWPGSSLDRASDRLWYSMKYDCAYTNAKVARRPWDCDWLSAPIGNKGCHYKKAVSSFFGAEQRKQLMDQATTLDEKRQYEQTPNSVAVSWEKQLDVAND